MELRRSLPPRAVLLSVTGAVTVAGIAAWFALIEAPAHAISPAGTSRRFDTLARNAPATDASFERRILALADVGRHDEVIALWEARIRASGHPPVASTTHPGKLHELVANAYVALGNPKEAVRAFNTAAFYFEADASDHALKLSYRALELDPKDSQALRRASRLEN